MSDAIEMSDHAWAQESIAAYLAGGLSADEAARLEAHARECAQCAAAVDSARRLDRELDSLFASVRPGLDLEDRAIQKFRVGPERAWPALPPYLWRPRRALAIAAAVLFLATFGALVGSIVGDGRLPMPGSIPSPFRDAREHARISAEREEVTSLRELSGLDSSGSMTGKYSGDPEESLRGREKALKDQFQAQLDAATRETNDLKARLSQSVNTNGYSPGFGLYPPGTSPPPTFANGGIPGGGFPGGGGG